MLVFACDYTFAPTDTHRCNTCIRTHVNMYTDKNRNVVSFSSTYSITCTHSVMPSCVHAHARAACSKAQHTCTPDSKAQHTCTPDSSKAQHTCTPDSKAQHTCTPDSKAQHTCTPDSSVVDIVSQAACRNRWLFVKTEIFVLRQ
jgi:hypothetical protein